MHMREGFISNTLLTLMWDTGGHLNPALTFALTIARRFPWKDLPFYMFAQYLGALAASGTVLGIYYGGICTSNDYFYLF
jgi:glycerol uptake facilitator-like aquaporin